MSRPEPGRIGPTSADLLVAFADASDALFEAGVIRSDSFTGEIGEFVASRTLGLTLLGRNTASIDATRAGRGYQVKSVANDDRWASIPVASLVAGFDVLVCVRLSLHYAPVEVIEIEASDLPLGTRIVTERLLTTIRCHRHNRFPATVTAARSHLVSFGEAYDALLSNGVIRTRHIVGDVGASYAAEALGLTLIDDPTNAGYDAVSDIGATYEIKTRRVYESGRRTSDTRRINNLVGKSADTLVVVQLDRSFRCTALWTMPLANVRNPKSANMSSFLRTPGIRQIR